MDLGSTIASFLGSMPPELVVVVLAMIPILELRGALPVAVVVYHMDIAQALELSILGNLLPVVPLLLFLEPVSCRLRRWKTWDRFFSWLFERTRRSHTRSFERWEAVALALFVAVPLPMTGAWTGAAAAFVFGMRFRTALAAIAAGVVAAGLIVSMLVALGMLSLGG